MFIDVFCMWLADSPIVSVTTLILVISSRKFGSSGEIPWHVLSLKGQKFVIYSAMLVPPVNKLFIRKKITLYRKEEATSSLEGVCIQFGEMQYNTTHGIKNALEFA